MDMDYKAIVGLMIGFGVAFIGGMLKSELGGTIVSIVSLVIFGIGVVIALTSLVILMVINFADFKKSNSGDARWDRY